MSTGEIEPPKAGSDLTKELPLGKIIKLFQHPDTSSHHDRQIAQLRRIIRHNPAGYQLKKLPDLQKIMLLALEKLNDGVSEFIKPLTQLVYLAGHPFHRDCSNEELTPNGLASIQLMYECLNSFLLTAEDINLQAAAAAALTEVAQGKTPPGTTKAQAEIKVLGVLGGVVANDQRPKPRDLNQSLLNKSGVVAGCCSMLKTVSSIMIEKLDVMMEAGSLGYVSDTSDEEEDDAPMEGTIPPSSPLTASLEQPSVPSVATEASASTVAGATASLADPASPSPRILLMSLLKLLSEISENATNSAALVSLGGDVTTMAIVDRLNDDRDSVLNLCVEILWNCLEHSAHKLENSSPSTSRTDLVKKRRVGNSMYTLAEGVGVLCSIFKELLVRGFRNKDKETRNEILILSSLIARNPRSHPYFVSSKFVRCMCIYATVAEVGTDPDGDGEEVDHVDPHNFATVSPADIELKRILWGLLSELCRADNDVLAIVVESPLIEALLMYLDTDLDGDGVVDNPEYVDEEVAPEDVVDEDGDGVDDQLQQPAAIGGSGANSIIARIPRTQLRVLQQQALMVLLNLAPRAPEKFTMLGGPIIVLRFLDWCGDSPLNRELVQGALMLLISVVKLPGLQDELAQMDAMRIMLGRFNDKSSPEALRADAVRIISRLCAGHQGNQEILRRNTGIMPLVKEIEEYNRHRRIICGKPKVSATGAHVEEEAEEEEDGGGSLMGGSAKETISPLIVAVVDTIWCAVIGNNRSEARFLQCQGQDALLDLLEICPRLMRNQVVGVLADLLQNKRCTPYIKSWRSDRSMVSAVSLLCRLWEEEEKRLKKERCDGVITNLWKPLGGHEKGMPVPETPTDFFNEFGKMNLDLDGDGIDDGLQTTRKAKLVKTLTAFKKLEKALAAGAKRGGNLEQKLKKGMKNEDLRGKIASLVGSIGWDEAKKDLSAHEKLTLTMVENWLHFTLADEWMRVRDILISEGVKPVSADALMVGSHLEESFATASALKACQGKLHREKQQAIVDEEEGFFGSILMQRDQEIHQLQIKKKASMPKSLAKRKAEKEAKAKMLAQSTVHKGDAVDKGPGVDVRVVDDGAEEKKAE
ncbi:hypothetical protein TrRE_jg6614 [Triparma retinervis]|uniref:Cilia- and flagella-associated protein 69 ARM repeats domain-containing protein n=1 Tax=Triparma retinervis TaxID=2557542 RepID=A0A9W7KUG2_9STRA|nr:hypothetical protein TrRE_jg6614 [Triparma retinervis]